MKFNARMQNQLFIGQTFTYKSFVEEKKEEEGRKDRSEVLKFFKR